MIHYSGLLMLRCLVLSFLLLLSACQQKALPDVFRMNIHSEPPTLDPRKATDTTSMNVLLHLFEGLMRFDSEDRPAFAGAESVEISDNECVYTFQLREHLWSNGDPVTARDYVETWRSLLQPQSAAPFAYKLFCIEGAEEVRKGAPPERFAVQAIDRHTLRIRLKHPVPYFLELVSLPTFYPIHTENNREHPLWATDAAPSYISNGPFTLKKWDHENEIILEKNPFYWDEKKVHLQAIHLMMVSDVATELYLFETGALDWAGSPMSTLPIEFLPTLKKEGKLCHHHIGGLDFYKLNCTVPPLNNAKVRRALGLAINRADIVTHVLQGEQKAAHGLVPGHPSLFDDNPALARRLFIDGLREEGFPSPPTLKLSYNTNTQHQKIAQAIQQQWYDTLGLTVELENCDWKVYLSQLALQNFEIARCGWIAEHHDPISYLESYVSKDHANNETGWENEHYHALITQSYYEQNPDKRRVMLEDAEKLLIEEMPIIPLCFSAYSFLKKPYVKDVHLSTIGLMDLKEASVDR